ncbi:TetR/AcrR family transcriptional regulator [Hyalangium versicolor]|uniref:TetR/AcrR family transcriptional regulator n=1 Tax=Hyalangium versicolor TaxID=2861190 RepID=UPI001CCD9A12|nr:TetR/AcrR family transcriptional regulator [Hyalangium versicolor]
MARPADPNARTDLISAARAEFVKKGLRGARIEDITAACGLSKGAFYLHFASKEALFGEVVDQVRATLDTLSHERFESMERFFTEHGRPDARDLAERSERLERLVRLETELDLRTLEVMWDYRDVMHVLLRGSQGTEYENLFPVLVDREVERVATDCRRLQEMSTCRSDVNAKLFGTVIVGTYALLVQQMTLMQEKPDLAGWASELQRIFREGVMPRDTAPAPVRAPRAAASRTSTRQGSSRAHTRHTSRKS